ncbi:MAG TPA: hypothetical protein VFQ15_00150 [Jiangellaceae bacterium]|nr:hypothetical protein [Jiangellaceae bacterium]
MTAVVTALLGSVLLATAVLIVVGVLHEVARSPRWQLRLGRWRRAAAWRAGGLRDDLAWSGRLARRWLAERL